MGAGHNRKIFFCALCQKMAPLYCKRDNVSETVQDMNIVTTCHYGARASHPDLQLFIF